jgi:hypothetical protein
MVSRRTFPVSSAVYWRDLEAGETRAVSQPPGSDPLAMSDAPTISAAGQWVAFQTTVPASLFEPSMSDGNAATDIILHDTLARTNYVVSRSSANPGFTDSGASTAPALSRDGRWLAYFNNSPSTSSGLLLYVRDLLSNATALVNLAVPRPPGGALPGCKTGITFSGDSRYLAFTFIDLSQAPDRDRQVFVHDLVNHTGTVVCVACENPSLSADGRYVVVQTGVRPDSRIVLFDRHSGLTNLISAVTVFGPGRIGPSYSPVISGDARFILFVSRATLLDQADTNRQPNLYVHDRVGATTMALRVGANSGIGDGPSYTPIMAADGRTVVFASFASDLVSGDYNDRRDVFTLRLADTDGDGLDDDWEVAFFNDLSRDGNGDFDHDGQSDRAEFLSGTDPTNTGSVLRALTVTPESGTAVTVYWNAVPGRTYQVQYKDNVAAGWTTIYGQVTATSTTASKVDSSDPLPAQRFYRVVLAP